MKTILVAGGAGYIGSHMCAALERAGYDVVVADDISTGHKQAVKYGKLYVGDVRDAVFLNNIFAQTSIDGVIDFAACSLVGESCKEPLKYYMNNLNGAQVMLDVMRAHGVKKIVFSSTAAVYGEPEKQPIEETDRTEPTNPYGDTKLAIEKLLKWCDIAYGIKYAALRYFNAAGADNNADIGEDHRPESHLIPIVLSAALGKREYIGVFGDDYPTRDGTCVRDYIDVKDLTRAHLLAYEFLSGGGESEIFNLGNGSGFSVTEIIQAAREVTGRDIPARVEPRRAGDPSTLIASNKKAEKILGWKPLYTKIEDIIKSAWNWHKSHPDGYGE
ncbi:MAG: UDP-glucose 4-epimerase GalE [Christensenellales bacterium]